MELDLELGAYAPSPAPNINIFFMLQGSEVRGQGRSWYLPNTVLDHFF